MFLEGASGALAPTPGPKSTAVSCCWSLRYISYPFFLSAFLSVLPSGKHPEETTITTGEMPLFTASAVTDVIQSGIEYAQMRYWRCHENYVV